MERFVELILALPIFRETFGLPYVRQRNTSGSTKLLSRGTQALERKTVSPVHSTPTGTSLGEHSNFKIDLQLEYDTIYAVFHGSQRLKRSKQACRATPRQTLRLWNIMSEHLSVLAPEMCISTRIPHGKVYQMSNARRGLPAALLLAAAMMGGVNCTPSGTTSQEPVSTEGRAELPWGSTTAALGVCDACGNSCPVGTVCTANGCMPPVSCNDYKQQFPTAPSGTYNIDPDGPGGQPAFPVFCEMMEDGGGWTLIARAEGWRFSSLTMPWVDLLSQNFYWNAGFQVSASVDPGYQCLDFFALLKAAADMPFKDVRFLEGHGTSIQSMTATSTLRDIHAKDGVEPLYRDGVNTGVLLLLGNASHTANFPCYYPNIQGTSCSAWIPGDAGSQATAFYVGDLARCSGGPAAGDLVGALWGSMDCYAKDTSGGHAGFTYHRTADRYQSYVNSGYQGAGWSVYLR